MKNTIQSTLPLKLGGIIKKFTLGVICSLAIGYSATPALAANVIVPKNATWSVTDITSGSPGTSLGSLQAPFGNEYYADGHVPPTPNSDFPLGSVYHLHKTINLSGYSPSTLKASIAIDNFYEVYVNDTLLTTPVLTGSNSGDAAWSNPLFISGFHLGNNDIDVIVWDDGQIGAYFGMEITAWPTNSAPLINVQFGDPNDPNGGNGFVQKTGFAAAPGFTSSDYWNVIGMAFDKDLDPPEEGQPAFAENCLDEDGNPTFVTVGVYPNPDVPWSMTWGTVLSSDPLFSGSLYTQGGGDYTVDISGLSSGTYDVYFYALNSLNNTTSFPTDDLYTTTITLLSGVGTPSNWSPLTTSTGPFDPDVYQEGNQYVVFRNLVNPSTLSFNVSGTGPILNGIQIVKQ